MSKTNTLYKHIIWDWNGTLLNDAWLCVDVMNNMRAKRKMSPINGEIYEQLFDFPVIDYYLKLGFDFEKEPFEDVSTEFITEYDERKFECNLRDKAEKILAAFLEKGVPQSILSAAKHNTLNDIVKHFSLENYFNDISGLDDHHAFGKTENARRMVASIDCDPREVLLIGDTVHDFEVAREAGIDCRLIYSGHQDQQRLKACGVDILEDLEAALFQ